MDCSYTAVYGSYVSFCNMLQLPHLSFEDWMHAREDSGDHRDLASDFIRSSVPGSPVPACSPR